MLLAHFPCSQLKHALTSDYGAGEPPFNATLCKSLLSVDAWNSTSITYWSHSWWDSEHDNKQAGEEQEGGEMKKDGEGLYLKGKNREVGLEPLGEGELEG